MQSWSLIFLSSWFDTIISFNDPKFSPLKVIWDESARNLEGVMFLCWMNERYDLSH